MAVDNRGEYSEIINYYDSIANGYDELYFEEQKHKFKILKEALGLSKSTKNMRMLDVGCGTFFSYDYFKKYVDVQGVEPSSKMVDLFVKTYPEEKKSGGGIIRVGLADDVAKIYGKDQFDFLICVSVAHHFKEPKDVFLAMSIVCKDSALLGITLLKGVQNFNALERALHSVFAVDKKIDSGKDFIYICKKK